MRTNTIIFYGIPAYGHINATLLAVRRLTQQGTAVVYYALPEFQQQIEDAGARFRAYPIGDRVLHLEDGSRLFRFYRLLLEVTLEWIEPLEKEARGLRASCILHDSAAHWGKRVAERLGLPAVSFCSLMAINRPLNPSFWAYVRHFSPVLWKDLQELPVIFRYRYRMRKEQSFRRTGMLPTMMNWGRLNILTYPRKMQVGGRGFDSRFFFLGSAAACRAPSQLQPACRERLLYVSLGTIFNDNLAFYHWLFRELNGSDYQVILSAGALLPRLAAGDVPSNFTIVRYVDQLEILGRAAVFLTAGGMNSLCEAVHCGVPCLIFPQQGEQKISGRQLVKLGFGRLLRPKSPLLPQMEQARQISKHWDAPLASRLTTVHMEALLDKLGGLLNEEDI